MPETRKRNKIKLGAPRNASDEKAIAAVNRGADALQLRIAGAKWDDIAETLGYSARGACYNAAMTVLRSIPVQPAAEYREIECLRLDGIILAHWPLRANPASARIIIEAVNRRAKLLGLDLQPDAPPFLPLLVIALPGKPARIIRGVDDLMTLTDEERSSLTDLPAVIRQDPTYASAQWESILTFEGSTIQLPSSGAMVDALTFATHADYCGLDLTDKPMQRAILSEYMRAGSPYTEAVIICGMRSGKGTVGSVIAWYEMYQMLEMANPQRYYGLAPGQTISTLNIGTSETQAKRNVFKHIRDRINTGGRWFQELKLYLDRQIANWETDLALTLPKNLAMRSGNSRSASNIGGTNKLVLFDEISKYKTSDGQDNAREVYSNLKATTATFGDHARVISISSPEWEQDYGMQLLRQVMEREDSPLPDRCEGCADRANAPGYVSSEAKSHPRMYGLQMATWEANTQLSREQLWEIHNGAANPREFARNFGARPVGSSETYYPDPERWERQHTAALGLSPDPLRYPYDDKGALAAWWKPCCESRRYVHVDLGLTRDACGMAMAHQPIPGCRWFTEVDGQPNPLARKVVLDLCVQIKPPKAKGGQAKGEISFERVRQRIRDWKERGFNVAVVSFDGFQSSDSLQLLRKEGFKAELLSVDRNLQAHDTLQELLNTNQLAYGYHPVLIFEGKTVILKNGRKVDHPANSSKDCLDAAAGASVQAYKKGARKVFIGG